MRLDAYPVRAMLKLAGPVALARLGIMGMGLVDVIVVGQLAPDELAHQALAWAPTGVVLVTAIGLLTGVQVLAARAIGEGAPSRAGAVWRKGLMVSALAGGLAALALIMLGGRVFTSFGIAPELAAPSAVVMQWLALSLPLHLFYVATAFFLESIKRPMASMVVMWLANGVNLALNLLLVPEYGALGSAWATGGARLFLAGVLIWWVLRLPDARALGVRGGGEGVRYGALMQVGAAAALSQAAEAGAFSWMTIVAGRIGAEAVAAYQILLNMLAVVFMIALGLASATSVLTSEAVGRRANADAARASWTGLALNTVLMAAAAIIMLAFAAPIARAYTADIAISALVASLMGLAAAILAPDGGQVVAAAALRARGDNWFPTASHVVAYALVMPVLGFWWGETQGQGVAGLMLAIFWASCLSVAVLGARLMWLTRSPVRVAA